MCIAFTALVVGTPLLFLLMAQMNDADERAHRERMAEIEARRVAHMSERKTVEDNYVESPVRRQP